MNKLFPKRPAPENPALVIKAMPRSNAEFFYGLRKIDDNFVRVIPNTYDEIKFIQSLDVGYSVYAPWNGDGVLIRESHLPRL